MTDRAQATDAPTRTRPRVAISEDWLATLVGLGLLLLVVAGVVTRGMVP